MPTDIFQGHIDVPLSNYAQRFTQADLIADQVCPRVGSARQADKYWIHGRDELIPEANDDRAPGAAAKQIKRTLSSDNFMCGDHALAETIPIEATADNQPGIPPQRQDATRVLMSKILLNHEVRTATLLTTAANYPSGNKVALTGNDRWDAVHADSDPVADVMAGHEAVKANTGKQANTLLLSWPVKFALKAHALLIERIKYVRIGGLTDEDLAGLFEVQRIAIGGAISRTAAGVNSYVWGGHAALLYVDPTPSLMDISFAKTFSWTGAPGSASGFRTRIGPISPPSAEAEEVSVGWYHDEKITASEAGYLIEDAITV